MLSNCGNCIHFSCSTLPDDYSKTHGFCVRFNQVENKNTKSCICWIKSDEIAKKFINEKKAKDLNINLNNQLNFEF